MQKVCTKTIDPFRPVCGMGTPTPAAPYYTRRDLPTLTLTTSRPACGFRPLAEAQKQPIKKGQWIFDNRPIVS